MKNYLLTLIMFLCINITISAATNPTLPQATVNTTIPIQTGRTTLVHSGDNLQVVFDQANYGDTLILDAGATFGRLVTTGNNKTGIGWIIIKSSQVSLLSEDIRVKLNDAVNMPKIITIDSSPALECGPTYSPMNQVKASHIRFIGIEISMANNTTNINTLVKLGADTWQTTETSVPDYIIFDRCYIHGNSNTNLTRNIQMNCDNSAIINCYISDAHVIGQEAQNIVCWNGGRTILIKNNYLEGAGENVMFGGADPKIQNLVSSDITFINNYCRKPATWDFHNQLLFQPLNNQIVHWTNNPSPGPNDDSTQTYPPRYVDSTGSIAKHWSVKNLFELKNAKRVLIKGNQFEGNWVDGQAGMAIQFTPRNQYGNTPWVTVEDITFESNSIVLTNGGINILGTDNNFPSNRTSRLRISNNLFDYIDGRYIQFSANPTDIIIEHNTARHTYNAIVFAANTVVNNFVVQNNINSESGGFGVFGDNSSEGLVSLNLYAPNYVFTHNVITGRIASLYPVNNYFPTNESLIQFTDTQGGNFKLLPTSPYVNQATDGKDIGIDWNSYLLAQNLNILDTTPPIISNINVVGINPFGGTVQFDTNENSSCFVEFGYRNLSAQTKLDSLSLHHSFVFDYFAPGALFGYRATCIDNNGNRGIGSYQEFKTLVITISKE